MEIMDSIRAAFKELILPELDKIKEENGQIRVAIEMTNKRLDDTNKRLDDINLHLVDQSRRIDGLRAELTQKIDETNNRIDNRIDGVRAELTSIINDARKTFDTRMDQLFQVIVRRDEHYKLENRLSHLEREVQRIKVKVAA